MTWYAAGDNDAPDDPAAWSRSSPALVEGRISAATIRDELRALTPATFRRERLNLWADAADEWLPPGVWARQVSRHAPVVWARAVLAVEIEPAWSHATIALALVPTTDDAPTYVTVGAEIVAPPGSTIAPAEILAALEIARQRWAPALVVWSKSAAVHTHLESWAAEVDAPTLALGPAEIRNASELFRAELVGRRLEHEAEPLLALQARRARPSGPLEAGAWYFSIRESRGPIDALRAAAFASWGALAPEAVAPQAEIF